MSPLNNEVSIQVTLTEVGYTVVSKLCLLIFIDTNCTIYYMLLAVMFTQLPNKKRNRNYKDDIIINFAAFKAEDLNKYIQSGLY